MSVNAMAAVFKAKGLTPTEKLILLALADHASEDGLNIYPSVETVCEKTALGERTVRRTIKSLRSEECGILFLVKRKGRLQNEYGMNLIKLRDLPENPPRPATLAPQEVPESTVRPAAVAPDPSEEPSDQPSGNSSADKPRTPAPSISNGIKERLPEYIDLFCVLSGIKQPAQATKREQQAFGVKWCAPLMRIDKQADGKREVVLDAIRRALSQMQADELTVQAPISIEAVATGIMARDTVKANGSGALSQAQKVIMDLALNFDGYVVRPEDATHIDATFRAAWAARANGRPLPRIGVTA